MEHEFVVLNSPDWINVVPVTKKGEILFIKQFRAGTQAISLEVPGGLIEEGETPLSCAIRELREETGALAQEWKLIGEIYPNPAFQNNKLYTFLAKDVEIKYNTKFDPGEYIEIEFVPEERILELITKGVINHSLVIVALYWYLLYKYKDKLFSLEKMIEEMVQKQEEKLFNIARRINKKVTLEDIKNPHDFLELAHDPEFNYEDGTLNGLNTVLFAIRREKKNLDV